MTSQISDCHMTRQESDLQTGLLRKHLDAGGFIEDFMEKHGIEKNSEEANEVFYALMYKFGGIETDEYPNIYFSKEMVMQGYITKDYERFFAGSYIHDNKYDVNYLRDLILRASQVGSDVACLMIEAGFEIKAQGTYQRNVLDLLLPKYIKSKEVSDARIFSNTIKMIESMMLTNPEAEPGFAGNMEAFHELKRGLIAKTAPQASEIARDRPRL